jgi:pimeloyl-ACP methyl ester carboxylesterase
MDALGYERFSVVGLDTGMVISYALAADHPERVARLVVGEAPLPGVTNPRPPLFLPGPVVPALFHLTFNRLDGLNEQLVRGREDLLLRLHLRRRGRHQAPRLRRQVLRRRLRLQPRRAPRQLRVLPRVGRDHRAEQAAQATKLTMPVLAIGGETSSTTPPSW